MAQDMMSGMTDYSTQSVLDIAEDINNWVAYSNKITTLLLEDIDGLRENDYWNGKVPYDLKVILNSIPRFCNTICHDLGIVAISIKNDTINDRDIGLMNNLYLSIVREERDLVHAYNDRSEGVWKDYSSADFRIVENLYQKVRDFYATLKDISNAAARMVDYMRKEKDGAKIDNSVHVDNSITVGNNNEISNSMLGHANSVEKSEEKESFFHKYMWPIISGVAIAVIAALIGFWLGLE